MTITLTAPAWLTRQRAALAGLVVVTLWLVWPAPSDRSALHRAEHNGFQSALAASHHRELARRALDSLHVAQRQTDRVFEQAPARIAKMADMHFTRPARVDSLPHTILGDYASGDTLVALPLVRLKIREIIDTANVTMSQMRTQVMLERGRSTTAIMELEETIKAQDAQIAADADIIAALKGQQPPWYRRATSGVVHAGAGIACGGLAYLVAGPAGGIAGVVICAAVAGIAK